MDCTLVSEESFKLKCMRNLKISFLAFAFLLCGSCLRLDDNLFNPDNSIQEYLLDDYTGEVDFKLGPAYDIPQDLIHLMTLSSKLPEESGEHKIYAIYIGDISRIDTDTVIMYCHGNRDHMDFYWQRAKLLAHTGGKNRFGVMMVDYRGYGLSEGEATEKGLYADVNAALKWMKEQGLTGDRLIMYGFSMGTAPATEIAANPKEYALNPSWLILEAPFASAAVMVQDGSRLALPAEYLVDLKIDNAEEIKKVQQPFMWIHGIEDAFLSIRTHGEVVLKNYGGSRKKAIRVPGADHGEVPEKMGFPDYLEAVFAFIHH